DADAAVPRPCGARVRGGRNGYRNLVSSRSECNSQKGERRADDFLRWLCREGRLSAGNSAGGCARAKLAAGKAATCFACAGQASGQTLKCKPKKEIRNLEKGEEKKSAGVASLRGQGTPAYPARLRSERARNSSRNFRAATVTKLGKSLCCRNS